jgi:hypothetical protein
MTMRRCLLVGALAWAIGACLLWRGPTVVEAAEPFPSRLTDRQFWKLVSDFSEPDGNFRSDNLLSNEIWFQQALGALSNATRPGGAYLGVGPEQNFTYVAALKPAISFIVDVRRGNLDVQLMYKALFELSSDRADFVSRLFSRPRPDGIKPSDAPAQLFDAFARIAPNPVVFARTFEEVRKQLVAVHHFGVTAQDLSQIQRVLGSFVSMGPQIRYSPIGSAGGTIQPTYAELMAATDEVGVPRGFLANDATFAAVKDVERRNLIVPVVGDFAGAKAIRAIGRYLRSKGVTVSAFYLSNVEEYLIQDGVWKAFCANVATLPLDDTSTFIRSVRTDGPTGMGTAFMSQLRSMPQEVRDCSQGPQ